MVTARGRPMVTACTNTRRSARLAAWAARFLDTHGTDCYGRLEQMSLAAISAGNDSQPRRTLRQSLAKPALTWPCSVRADMASTGLGRLAGHRSALESGLLRCFTSPPGRRVSGPALAGSALMPGDCDRDPAAGGFPADPRTMARKPMRGLTGSIRHCLGQLRQLGDRRVSPSALLPRARKWPARRASDGCTTVRCRR